VPAIVTEEEWEATQKALDSRRHGRARSGSNRHLFPFGSRLRCGECGYAMSGFKSTPTVNYYGCHHRRNPGKDGSKCGHRRVYRTDQVHQAVLQLLRETRVDQQLLQLAVRVPEPRRVDTSAEQARIRRQLENAKVLALDGALTPAEYKVERARLEAQLAGLVAAEATVPFVPAVRPDEVSARILKALESDSLEDVIRDLDLRATIFANGDIGISIAG
jgi:hypothetical protein